MDIEGKRATDALERSWMGRAAVHLQFSALVCGSSQAIGL
jgi:hypothetical protein